MVQQNQRISAASATSNNATGIRVLGVDDHAVLLEGLRAQFELDGRLQLVGALSNADGVIDEVAKLRPDVVLLDIEMPGPDVFEIADRMRHEFPNQRFLFLSAHVRDGYLSAAYKAGAWGYFSKGDELEDIVDGIVQTARSASGAFLLGPKVRERCGPSASTNGRRRVSSHDNSADAVAPSTPLGSLTTRELEVLRLIGKGLSRTEIAAELSRSAKTIDGHQERMMKKLRIESRAELMRFAIREGLAEA